MPRPSVVIKRLPGLIRYEQAQALQRSLVTKRRSGQIADTLLILEHCPVFTLGRLQASASNMLAPPEVVAGKGARVVQSDRGGNITYHGPGQLVAYPVLDLGDNYCRDLHWYVETLQEAMIQTCGALGVRATAGGPGFNGVWIDDKKIGAVGVRVQRWVSSHGVALNASVDLDYFSMIVPCGLKEAPRVTSLSAELGRHVAVDEAGRAFESTRSPYHENLTSTCRNKHQG